MSYDEVAGLLERVTGQHVLSDQTIQHLVVAKAVEVSLQWQRESQADTTVPPLPAVMPQVDWYDPQSEEVLLLTDAMQVKQQKANRGQGADKPPVERETKRVHTGSGWWNSRQGASPISRRESMRLARRWYRERHGYGGSS